MKLKLILPILFLFIVSACKKSDDPAPASVVGKWTTTTIRSKSTGSFSMDVTFNLSADSYIQFNANGTGSTSVAVQGQTPTKSDFTYKVEGTKITLTNADKETSVGEIQNLTASGFVMYTNEKDGNNTSETWLTVKK